MSQLELKRVRLQTLARVLSGRGKLTLRFGSTAETNLNDITLIPFEGEIVPGVSASKPECWVAQKAICAHEAGHIKFTSKGVWERATVNPVLAHLLNIIEDARIERCMANTYPGTLLWFRFLNEYVFKNRPDWGTGPQALLSGLICYAVVGRVPKAIVEQDDVMELIRKCAPIIDRGRLEKDTEGAYKCALEIWEITKDYLKSFIPDEIPKMPGTTHPEKAPEGSFDPRRTPVLPKSEKSRPVEIDISKEESEIKPKKSKVIKIETLDEEPETEPKESTTESTGTGETRREEKDSKTSPDSKSKQEENDKEHETSFDSDPKTGEPGNEEELTAGDTEGGPGPDETESVEKSESGTKIEEPTDGEANDTVEDTTENSDLEDIGKLDTCPGKDPDLESDKKELSGEASSSELNPESPEEDVPGDTANNEVGEEALDEEPSGPTEPDDDTGLLDNPTDPDSENTSEVDNFESDEDNHEAENDKAGDFSDTSDDTSDCSTSSSPDGENDLENYEDSGSGSEDIDMGDYDKLLDSASEELFILESASSRAEKEKSRKSKPADISEAGINEELSKGLHEGCLFKLKRLWADTNSKKYYQAELQKIKPYIKQTTDELKKVLEYKATLKERNLRKGRLDSNSLWKIIGTKDPRVFYQVREPDSMPKLTIYLLIDCSGSMSFYGRISAARKSAILLYETCTALKIPVNITGFTSEIESLCDVTHYRVINFDDNANKKYAIVSLNGRSQNRDGYSIRVATRELLLRNEEQKVLIVLSDGDPLASYKGYEGYKAVKDTAIAVREAKKQGIGVIGMYFGDKKYLDIAQTIYNNLIYVEKIETLPRQVARVLKRVISNL